MRDSAHDARRQLRSAPHRRVVASGRPLRSRRNRAFRSECRATTSCGSRGRSCVRWPKQKASSLYETMPRDRSAAVGDPYEMRRAVTNLFANAIEATPSGGHVVLSGDAPRAHVDARDSKTTVRRSVRSAPALFHTFRRPSRSGTGLGIVHRAPHRGEIRGRRFVRTARAARLAFMLTLPAARLTWTLHACALRSSRITL